MADYLLIESRDPFEFRDTVFCAYLVRRLADTGNRVTIFLVQNGVLPARAGAGSAVLPLLAQAGVEIFADDFSLRERGISSERLQPGIKPCAIDLVIDRLAAGAKVIWH